MQTQTQTQSQSNSQTAVVLLSDYTSIYNEYQNALNEITRLKNSLRQQETIIYNQQQIIQRYQMITFQQQTSSANRPHPQPFVFPPQPTQTPQKPVIDLTSENVGMCLVNRPTMFNQPQVTEKKETLPNTQVTEKKETSVFNPFNFGTPQVTEKKETSVFSPFNFVTPQKNTTPNKRPIDDGDDTETDDELVLRKKTGKKFIKTNEGNASIVTSNEKSDRLQKILLDVNREENGASEAEEELLLHNKTSVSIPTRNELEDMAFSYAKKCFLNKKAVKVNFTFLAETELLDKIWYLNINGHRFLRINGDFRDTNITKFMNNEIEVIDELKIVDGVDLIEVKCVNTKWMQGITYSGMIKLLWYLANNHPQTCDKLLTKFSSTLEKIVYCCDK